MARKIVYSAKFKRNYVAIFAVVLFLLMVAAEIALAVSIPAYMRREDVLADQVKHREMLLRFDAVRSSCSGITSKDETLMMEKKLISDALDQLALYLRKEADRLTPEEVDELDALVTQAGRLTNRLRSGRPLCRENRLDTAAYVNSMVKKYAVKGIK